MLVFPSKMEGLIFMSGWKTMRIWGSLIPAWDRERCGGGGGRVRPYSAYLVRAGLQASPRPVLPASPRPWLHHLQLNSLVGSDRGETLTATDCRPHYRNQAVAPLNTSQARDQWRTCWTVRETLQPCWGPQWGEHWATSLPPSLSASARPIILRQDHIWRMAEEE